MTRACKTCDFFVPFVSLPETMEVLSDVVGHDKGAIDVLSQRGYCRIHPPAVEWNTIPGLKSAFPDVHEKEWCGHFMAAEDRIPENIA